MRRELLQITKRQHPHPVPERPAALWLLPPGCDTIPERLSHHRTAFLEDEMHDWHWTDGKLFYHGAGGDGRCHVVLLFEDEP